MSYTFGTQLPLQHGATVGVGTPTNPLRYVWGAGTAQETRAIARHLFQMANEIGEASTFYEAVNRSAELIASRMVGHLLPKSRSGKLAGTVRVRYVNAVGAAAARAQGGVAHVVVGSEEAPYAGVIQGGWPAKGIAAYPYMTWAIEESQREIGNIMQEAVDELDRKYQILLEAAARRQMARRAAQLNYLAQGMASSYVHPARYIAKTIVSNAPSMAAEYTKTVVEGWVNAEIKRSRANWRLNPLRSPITGRFVSRKDYPQEINTFLQTLGVGN